MLPKPHSTRSSFIRFVKERYDKYGIIHVFTDVEAELKNQFPQFFIDKKTRNNSLKTYSSAVSQVKKDIVKANEKIKTKSDVLHPVVQQTIKTQISESTEKFISGGGRKTIVLTLANNDKVFFKLSDKMTKNLSEFIRYWTMHSIGQVQKATATKAFFTSEMVEEYYRIFEEMKASKAKNTSKLKLYKALEKGMI